MTRTLHTHGAHQCGDGSAAFQGVSQASTLCDSCSGHVQPSSSPSAAPILFVSRRGASLRMCIDYRALNKVTAIHIHLPEDSEHEVV